MERDPLILFRLLATDVRRFVLLLLLLKTVLQLFLSTNRNSILEA